MMDAAKQVGPRVCDLIIYNRQSSKEYSYSTVKWVIK